MSSVPEFGPASIDDMFDVVPHQLWISDGEGRLQRRNARMAEYFGPALDRVAGNWLELLAARDRQLLCDAWHRAAAGGTPFQVDLRLPASDGSQRWFQVSAAPLALADGRQAWCGANTDIDSSRRIRTDLERAMQAQRRSLATVNHDLRQPLSAILFLIASLQQRTAEESDRRMLAAINNAVHTMKVMVDNQLDFGRLNAGSLRPAIAVMPINSLLTRMAIEFAPLAAAKGLGLSVHPCAALIQSDAQLLERMLRNLLFNALRYTRTGRIVLGCRRRGGRLRIEVHDSGRGVDEQERRLLAEPFYRSARSLHEHPGGLGLGLTVVDGLARVLDHGLSLETRVDRGSMFAITVALVEADHAPANRLIAGRPRILVLAGDEPVSADDLEAAGCLVGWADSEAEATERLRGDPGIELVLCGLMHRGVADGALRLHRLLQAAQQRTHGVLVTAVGEPVRLREVVLSGFPFLCLPMGRDDLQVKLFEIRHQPG